MMEYPETVATAFRELLAETAGRRAEDGGSDESMDESMGG
jgi:hypothetical protein